MIFCSAVAESSKELKAEACRTKFCYQKFRFIVYFLTLYGYYSVWLFTMNTKMDCAMYIFIVKSERQFQARLSNAGPRHFETTTDAVPRSSELVVRFSSFTFLV